VTAAFPSYGRVDEFLECHAPAALQSQACEQVMNGEHVGFVEERPDDGFTFAGFSPMSIWGGLFYAHNVSPGDNRLTSSNKRRKAGK
jgi:hypothetical protein